MQQQIAVKTLPATAVLSKETAQQFKYITMVAFCTGDSSELTLS